jgi:biopolymer transport protein ExbD
MNFRSGNKIKIEGGMSSMTDLVFLLLIFFIVISTMITAGVNIDVPKDGGTASADGVHHATMQYLVGDRNFESRIYRITFIIIDLNTCPTFRNNV